MKQKLITNLRKALLGASCKLPERSPSEKSHAKKQKNSSKRRHLVLLTILSQRKPTKTSHLLFTSRRTRALVTNSPNAEHRKQLQSQQFLSEDSWVSLRCSKHARPLLGRHHRWRRADRWANCDPSRILRTFSPDA